MFSKTYMYMYLDDYPLGGFGLGLFDPSEIVNYSRPKDSDAEV